MSITQIKINGKANFVLNHENQANFAPIMNFLHHMGIFLFFCKKF